MNTIKIPIEKHFAGSYRIEYDGKYITLYGRDKNHPIINNMSYPAVESDLEYDEMVLVSCVAEIRGVSPIIKKVTDKFIIIALRCKNI